MRCNPASSNCRVAPQKIGIKWVFSSIISWAWVENKTKYQIEWCYYCNVMTYCVEFEWGSVTDAALNMNAKREIHWGDFGEIGVIGLCIQKWGQINSPEWRLFPKVTSPSLKLWLSPDKDEIDSLVVSNYAWRKALWTVIHYNCVGQTSGQWMGVECSQLCINVRLNFHSQEVWCFWNPG